MKKLLSLLLIICICFCAVGCNKVTDTNSSDLSSTITEIETETVIVEEESSTNDTTAEESKIETPATNKPSENATPTQSTITSSSNTQNSLATSETETPTTSKDPNAPLTDEELKEFMPDWFFEYPAREIVDISPAPREAKLEGIINFDYFVITTQNELYKFSPYKLFSNGSHFMKVVSDVKVIKFFACVHTYMANSIRGECLPILTTDNKILVYNPSTDKIETHPWLQNSGCINNECPTDYKNIFGTIGRYCCSLQESCVVADQVRYNNNNILSLDNEILYSFPQDETIVSAVTHVVQTTKGYYYIRGTTEQEFADSEPITTYSAEFIGTKPEDRFIKYFRENS